MSREFEIRGNEAGLAGERREGFGHDQSDISVRLKLEGADRLDQGSVLA